MREKWQIYAVFSYNVYALNSLVYCMESSQYLVCICTSVEQKLDYCNVVNRNE